MSHQTPNKCATCGKPATIFVGFVTNGKVHSQAWCEAHAAAVKKMFTQLQAAPARFHAN